MKLKNKTVLITGASSGLGFETAKLLVKKGAKVIVLGKDESRVEQARKDLNSSLVSTIVCDIRSSDQVNKTVGKIKKLDVLINSAGIIAYCPLEKHDPQNIKDIIDTNLLGTIYITKSILRLMKKNNNGTIVNISSTSGLPSGGHANESIYMASKYGVTGFTEGLKKEIGEEKKNIRIIGFYPGGMKTELFAKSGLDKDISNFMNPKEIAEIIVFMLERPESIKMDHVVVNRNK